MAVGEWDQRQLCPDGACIGVIGPDGTCKVCGRAAPNWGDERNRGLIDPEDEDPDEANLATARADEEEEEDDDDDEDGDDGDEDDGDEDDDEDDEDDEDDDGHADEAPEPGVVAAPSGVWSARQLCPDGACIGVIGPDGRCKVCGRRASEVPAAPPSSEPASTPVPAASSEPASTPVPAASSEPASTPVPAASSEPASASAGPEAGPAIDSRNSPIEAAAVAPAAGDREPCPTPGCGGHIAADGRCAVCGKGAS
jgi:hypothetical protein